MKEEGNSIQTKIARLEEQLNGAKEALKIQAAEYERRLDILNGEAERLRQMQATYLPREVYDTQHESLEQRLEVVTKFMYVGIGLAIAIEIILRFVA